MAVIEFVQNYDDLSTDQGYQFKFHCNHCGNGYLSTYKANQLGVAGGLLRAAGGLFGGLLGNAGNSAYELQRAIGGPAHDGALNEAVQEIKPLFLQCHRCGTWVCGKICWNPDKGLCKQCAPILVEEVAAAQAQAGRDQVFEKAHSSDMSSGVDVNAPTNVSCPHCGAATKGGKFCPDCGSPLSAKKTHCTECGVQMDVGTKFCPECGAKS